MGTVVIVFMHLCNKVIQFPAPAYFSVCLIASFATQTNKPDLRHSFSPTPCDALS